LLKVSSWNKIDQPFARQDGSTIFSIRYGLTGSAGEKIYFSDDEIGMTKVMVKFKNKTEYYTMSVEDCTAAQNYLVSLFNPQAPIDRIFDFKIESYFQYWTESNSDYINLTTEQVGQLKSLLNMTSWRQAINMDPKIPTAEIANFATSDKLYFVFAGYGDQVLIGIIDASTVETYYQGFAWSYLAPGSIKNDLLDFIATLK